MLKLAVTIPAMVAFSSAASAQILMSPPHPPAPNSTAPRLSALSERDLRDALSTQQRCILKVGKDILVVATEKGRQAVAVIDGTNVSFRYQGPNPLRNGGRFLPSVAALDIWISVDPRQDQALAIGLPRNVTVLVNGRNGASGTFRAEYTCNY